MSNKTNPILIGLFVVIAIFVAVSTVMILGASSFKKSYKAVCFFKDSVNGLVLGAPVKFKGVEIGKVSDIVVRVSPEDPNRSSIAVYMAISPEFLAAKRGEDTDVSEFLKMQRNNGLRAMLSYQSIVTGMLYVEMDYFAKPTDIYTLHGKTELVEVPIMDSALKDTAKKLQKMVENLSDVDFAATMEKVNTLLATTNQKIDNIDTKAINANTLELLNNLNASLKDVDIKKTMEHVDELVVDTKKFVEKTSNTLDNLDKNAVTSFENLNRLLLNINSLMSQNSTFRYELNLALKNLSSASISIKALADYLERNPNALLTGKYIPQK